MVKNLSTTIKELEYLINDSKIENEQNKEMLNELCNILKSNLLHKKITTLLNSIDSYNPMNKINKQVDEIIEKLKKEKKELTYELDNYSIFLGSNRLDELNQNLIKSLNLKDYIFSDILEYNKMYCNLNKEKENTLLCKCYKNIFSKKNDFYLFWGKSLALKRMNNIDINQEILNRITNIFFDKELSDSIVTVISSNNKVQNIKYEIKQLELILDNYKFISKLEELDYEIKDYDREIINLSSNIYDPLNDKIKKYKSDKILSNLFVKKIENMIQDRNCCWIKIDKIYSKRKKLHECRNKIKEILIKKNIDLNYIRKLNCSEFQYKCLLNEKISLLKHYEKENNEINNNINLNTKILLDENYETIKNISDLILENEDNYISFYILYTLNNIETLYENENNLELDRNSKRTIEEDFYNYYLSVLERQYKIDKQYIKK